jgi:hypothetical protein
MFLKINKNFQAKEKRFTSNNAKSKSVKQILLWDFLKCFLGVSIKVKIKTVCINNKNITLQLTAEIKILNKHIIYCIRM